MLPGPTIQSYPDGTEMTATDLLIATVVGATVGVSAVLIKERLSWRKIQKGQKKSAERSRAIFAEYDRKK